MACLALALAFSPSPRAGAQDEAEATAARAVEPQATPAAAQDLPLPTASPDIEGDDQAGPVPTAEEEARAKQDQLQQQRTELEQIEEVAPEALRVSDLPDPCTGPWDWVRLSSGEWLRGEFKRMREKRLVFESTRMKSQTIDWKHVIGFCFPGDTRFVLDDRTVLIGHGRLLNGVLTVTGQEVSQTAPRDDIWTILPGLPTEWNRWRAKLGIGLDAYTGNTNQQSVTASAALDREAKTTHLDLDYTTSFGQNDGVQNVKRHRATGIFDVYFDRTWFASVPGVAYTSDTFQNIQQRVTPGLGLGAKVFDLEVFEWDLQLGLAYQYTQYVSVQPGQSSRENDVGPRFSTNLEWDIVGDLTFELGHVTVLMLRNFDQSNFHTEGSLVYDVTDLIYLEFSVWYDRIRQPRPTADGSIPDPNDTRTLVSIGLTFD